MNMECIIYHAEFKIQIWKIPQNVSFERPVVTVSARQKGSSTIGRDCRDGRSAMDLFLFE